MGESFVGQHPAGRSTADDRFALGGGVPIVIKGDIIGGVRIPGAMGGQPPEEACVRTAADTIAGELQQSISQGEGGLRIISAAFSAIIMVGAAVLPEVIDGITEASTTRKPPTPRTFNCASTTA